MHCGEKKSNGTSRPVPHTKNTASKTIPPNPMGIQLRRVFNTIMTERQRNGVLATQSSDNTNEILAKNMFL
uniref:Uncharacterized protein n=1 Tax=Anguilla anguilla TaxID=7936 RepID=A0A0E9QAD2_ANGAN